MRIFAAAAATMLLLAGAAQAQAPMTGTTTPLASPAAPVVAPPAAATKGAPAAQRRGRTLQERFDEANVTHDGHLTREQAKAKMPAVARDFDQIDTTKAGYVTVDQIRDHTREARAKTRAAHKAAATAKPQ
jgi:hypothetical protein